MNDESVVLKVKHGGGLLLWRGVFWEREEWKFNSGQVNYEKKDNITPSYKIWFSIIEKKKTFNFQQGNNPKRSSKFYQNNL